MKKRYDFFVNETQRHYTIDLIINENENSIDYEIIDLTTNQKCDKFKFDFNTIKWQMLSERIIAYEVIEWFRKQYITAIKE